MKIVFCCTALLALLMQTDAYAESSGWINAHELQRFNSKVLRKGYIPTSMKCKNTNASTGMNRKNTLVNVQYRANPKKQKWSWAWGSEVKRLDINYKKLGYKRVSYSSFRRPSGLLMPCAVWHKK